MRDFVKAVAQFTFMSIIRIVLVTTGLIVVPLAIPFKVESFSVSDGRAIYNLPKWAYIWGNDFDGLLGDKKFWWAANTPFNLPVTHFISMFMWAAIRNPANNLRMIPWAQAPVTGSVITYKGDYTVEDDFGCSGWQFVKATNKGKSWYGFYLVHEYKSKPTHALVIRIGFKIKPSHQGEVDLPKGFVAKVSFFKKL